MIKAKQTFLAYQNFGKSVIKIYPEVFDVHLKNPNSYYVGIKNTSLLYPFVNVLDKNKYLKHTVDKMAHAGRAIDLDLINPLTGRLMTGSSSGTAMNVLLGINDIGIGTDGGGSVLSPAISLNLYGFISKVLPIEKVIKKSTDDIKFSVSTGIITKDIGLIKNLLKDLSFIDENILRKPKILYLKKEDKKKLKISYEYKSIIANHLKKRDEMIKEITEYFKIYDYIIFDEDRIDIEDYGDSIYGILKNNDNQAKGNKGYIRVCNMVNATALCIPNNTISSGTVIMCKSEIKFFNTLFEISEELEQLDNCLINNYFNCQTPSEY